MDGTITRVRFLYCIHSVGSVALLASTLAYPEYIYTAGPASSYNRMGEIRSVWRRYTGDPLMTSTNGEHHLHVGYYLV